MTEVVTSWLSRRASIHHDVLRRIHGGQEYGHWEEGQEIVVKNARQAGNTTALDTFFTSRKIGWSSLTNTFRTKIPATDPRVDGL